MSIRDVIVRSVLGSICVCSRSEKKQCSDLNRMNLWRSMEHIPKNGEETTTVGFHGVDLLPCWTDSPLDEIEQEIAREFVSLRYSKMTSCSFWYFSIQRFECCGGETWRRADVSPVVCYLRL